MTTATTTVSGVPGRYATAIFDLAKDGKLLDKVEADLSAIQSLVEESADFRLLIQSPLVSREEQAKAVLAILDKLGVQPVTHNFVGVVVKNGRLNLLVEMIAAFNHLLADERGEVTAEVTSPAKLTKAQLDAVSKVLTKHAGQSVRIEAFEDESLLGGLVVKLGSKMIDTSLKTKLENLQLAMKEVG